MSSFTPADWIAISGLTFTIAAKVLVDFKAYLEARQHTALANIVGMAQRQAATAARTLANLPAGTDIKGAEQALVASAKDAIVTEMSGSVSAAKGNDEKVATIVQGELDKIIVAPAAVTVPVVTQPAVAPVLNTSAMGPAATPSLTI